MQNTKLQEIKYFFFSIKFKPFADKSKKYDSYEICKDVLYHLSNIKNNGEAVLKDRNENRKNLNSRELFLSSAVIIPKDRRSRMTIALIRKGRRPKIKKKGTFNLQSISNLGEVVEVTNFFMDFSSDKNIICVEKNSNGPNIADIEYYLKAVAREDLKLCRTTELTVHMDNNIQSALNKVKNVLNFNIKIRPKNLSEINSSLKDKFLSGFDIVSSVYKPEFLRFEAFFKKRGRNNAGKRKVNKIATSMFKDFLKEFKSNPTESFNYDQFDVVYEDDDGIEDSFNLLKDKKSYEIKIPIDDDLSLKESYIKVEDKMSEVVKELEG